MTTKAKSRAARLAATRGTSEVRRGARVERMARALMTQHPCFRAHTAEFEFACRADVLTVRGQVPSFYLKQVLQTMLRKLADVDHVDNQVDVVCCDGLSSVRKP